MPGSIPVQIKYQYLFSIGYEFCIYHSTGANGWDGTKGTLALFERGPFSLLHHEKGTLRLSCAAQTSCKCSLKSLPVFRII